MSKLALVFPGQGSQAVGMGRELAEEFESAALVYRRASERLGWDVAKLCFEGPEDRLNRTDMAQVALYVNSMATQAVLREKGIKADMTSGHSLGEYSALAASGAFNEETGLFLVERRGKAMQAAAQARPGVMAAVIGLEDHQVEEVCSGSGEVWPVNYNSPGQIVISGEAGAARRAMAKAKEAGAKRVVELKVSGAFHSPLMQRAAEEMKEPLGKISFSDPAPPFLSSITCEYEKAGSVAGTLVSQIVSPVRWKQAVERLIADGVGRFIEVGNGKVLSGLIRRINRDVETMDVSNPEGLKKVLMRV